MKTVTADNLVAAADASLRRLDTSEAEVPQTPLREIFFYLFIYIYIRWKHIIYYIS